MAHPFPGDRFPRWAWLTLAVGPILLLIVALIGIAIRPAPVRAGSVTTESLTRCEVSISDYPSVSILADGTDAAGICARFRRTSRATHSPIQDGYVACTKKFENTWVTASSALPLTSAERARVCSSLP
jgi:hypothetical protein